MWSGCRDSNSGPPRPERGALPTALHPDADLRELSHIGKSFENLCRNVSLSVPNVARYQLRYTPRCHCSAGSSIGQPPSAAGGRQTFSDHFDLAPKCHLHCTCRSIRPGHPRRFPACRRRTSKRPRRRNTPVDTLSQIMLASGIAQAVYIFTNAVTGSNTGVTGPRESATVRIRR